MALHNFTLTGQRPQSIDINQVEVKGWDENGIDFRVWLPAGLEPKSQADGNALFGKYLIAYDPKSGKRYSGKVHSYGMEYQAWYIDATIALERHPS